MTAPRVRFAPSPTGSLHVGGARTALYNWLFARRHGGTFILRIEDTDVERSRKELTQQILDAMTWLGLSWDEGPFFQSERQDLYREAAARLLAEGKAYRAFETPEELEAREEGRRGRRDGVPVLRRGPRDPAGGVGPPRRRGREVRPPAEDARRDDRRRRRRPGARRVSRRRRSTTSSSSARTATRSTTSRVCVDDVAMGITHVVRGVDHLPEHAEARRPLPRPRRRAAPVFAHLGMILGADGKKLSKRHGAAGVEEFREQGFLPEALVNFLALLGWSPGEDREKMTMEEMIRLFSLERIGPSPSRFDHEKLLWLNGQYLPGRSPRRSSTGSARSGFPTATRRSFPARSRSTCRGAGRSTSSPRRSRSTATTPPPSTPPA